MIKTILMGRLTRDVELRTSTTGVMISKFSVACSTGIITKNGVKETEFVNCVAFNTQAETINQYFHKGSQISIIGRNKTSKYTDQNGIDKYSTDVVVESFEFVDKKSDTQSSTQYNQPVQDTYAPLNDEVILDNDDLPF